MNKLKLEAGKKYLNGNGEIVTIVEDDLYKSDEDGDSRFRGIMQDGTGLWYAEDGTFNCAWEWPKDSLMEEYKEENKDD